MIASMLLVVTVQTAMLFDKVRLTYSDHILTFDLKIPTWPFAAVAWLGDVSAVLLIAGLAVNDAALATLLGGAALITAGIALMFWGKGWLYGKQKVA